MIEKLTSLFKGFRDWVEGNGPRPENEGMPPEAPPPLPFTLKPPTAHSARFHELTIRERRRLWLESYGGDLFSSLYVGIGILACVLFVFVLLAAVAELPPFGDPGNPANNEVVQRYVERGGRETGAQNIVAGMILDYRAFDTFGESVVLFTAAVCVLMLLSTVADDSSSRTAPCRFVQNSGLTALKPVQNSGLTALKPVQNSGLTALKPVQNSGLTALKPVQRDDAILRGVASLSIPIILLLGCAVVVEGHLSPGGGFSGGAILSAGLILCANAYGFDRVHRVFSERTFVMSSSGALLAYAVMKGWSFFSGANHIESGIPTGKVGNILSGGLILPLNICVGLVVAGTLYSFYALFSEGEI
ncbi:MAG: hypothetical protein IJR68_09145 [Fretibacterium sp.]|nr:hypothetical protein [Fretibacterium sp.]